MIYNEVWYNEGMRYQEKRNNKGQFIPVILNRIKICKFCGKEFTPPTRNFARDKFCSRSCASKSHPSGRTGKKNSQYQKDMAKLKMSGVLHPRWIKDRTKLKDDSKDRGGQLHREWSKNIKKRDGWKCRIDNKYCMGKVTAHHILSWRDYPELRYEINNGITLCEKHHPKKRKDEIKFISVYKNIINHIIPPSNI